MYELLKIPKVRAVLIAMVAIIVFFAGLGVVRKLILGSTPVTQVDPGKATSQAVSSTSANAANSGSNATPTLSQDFAVGSTTYLLNRQWAVVQVVSTTTPPTDDAYVVMQKQGTTYQTVIGPGTAFDSSALNGAPKEVLAYLRQHDLLYDSSGSTDNGSKDNQ